MHRNPIHKLNEGSRPDSGIPITVAYLSPAKEKLFKEYNISTDKNIPRILVNNWKDKYSNYNTTAILI